jgi:hypothetical protein
MSSEIARRASDTQRGRLSTTSDISKISGRFRALLFQLGACRIVEPSIPVEDA